MDLVQPAKNLGADFIASFKIKLRRPIHSVVRAFPDLRFTLKDSPLKKVVLRIAPNSNGLVENIAVECVYSGNNLQRMFCAGRDTIDVVNLGEGGGILSPPWEIATTLLRPVLYYLGALTLQASVFYPVEDYLATSVHDFNWTMPDGKIIQSTQQVCPSYPFHAFRVLREAGVRELTEDDWSVLQKGADGQPMDVPLWRMILADALRERENDIRVAIVHCATALDIAAQDILPPNIKFSMRVLRGEEPGAGIPDLRQSNPELFNDISQLWYTRHGIVHRGEMSLYDRNPQDSTPLRKLTVQDAERFIIAVPQGVAFLGS